MNDENPTAPISGSTPDTVVADEGGGATATATLPPPAEETPDAQSAIGDSGSGVGKVRFRDRVWGWKATLGVAVASLILGGLAGFGLGHFGGHDDDHGFGPGHGHFRNGPGNGFGPGQDGGQNGQNGQMAPPNGQNGPGNNG